MSNNLREYVSMRDDEPCNNMSITAFIGGKWGNSIQFTIGGQYCALAENQVKDLANTLKKRLKCIHKYAATSPDIELTVIPKMKK